VRARTRRHDQRPHERSGGHVSEISVAEGGPDGCPIRDDDPHASGACHTYIERAVGTRHWI